MTKYVITTGQIITRRYYVEVEDPSWAHDGIIMGELEEFSQRYSSEDVVDTWKVDEFPKPQKDHTVNGAQMSFDYDNNCWQTNTRWDLVK